MFAKILLHVLLWEFLVDNNRNCSCSVSQRSSHNTVWARSLNHHSGLAWKQTHTSYPDFPLPSVCHWCGCVVKSVELWQQNSTPVKAALGRLCVPKQPAADRVQPGQAVKMQTSQQELPLKSAQELILQQSPPSLNGLIEQEIQGTRMFPREHPWFHSFTESVGL